MADKIDYLKFRLHKWQEMKNHILEFKADVPKEIICMFADWLKDIANGMPDNLKWEKEMLLLLAQLLVTLCHSMPKEDIKNIQYSHTRG